MTDTDERDTMPTTWFITGTSSGFGRMLTEHLLGRGDRVAATLRRPRRWTICAPSTATASGSPDWTSPTPRRCTAS